MAEEVITPQDGTNPEPEVVVEDPTQGEDPQNDMEDVEALKDKLAQAEEAKRQLTARAKKAEEELKKATQSKPSEQINNPNGLSKEELHEELLLSQGKSKDLIQEMKALAKVRGKSLLEVKDDPIIKALEEEREKEAKQARARLGASRGSGQVKKEKNFNTPGLTEKEHKDLWKQQVGR